MPTKKKENYLFPISQKNKKHTVKERVCVSSENIWFLKMQNKLPIQFVCIEYKNLLEFK